jgi:hypothetical protein
MLLQMLPQCMEQCIRKIGGFQTQVVHGQLFFLISPVSESVYVAGKLNSCITVCHNRKSMPTLFGSKTLKLKTGYRKHMHCLLERQAGNVSSH